ncbi:AAA family ATPase [Shewanella violacea]|uniref:ATPase, putative n=1 Tax=Shewanella violacea (strain JCM 10179 / CIP 106290 / LMG 19151 / DSS12) TaxID=637905 RepID=D4ZI16_SHEVD|nr:AAA family ATPase [Shewanella violacea]BAJ01315.1 ATPase, putative [Shewanella violacea DSS12]
MNNLTSIALLSRKEKIVRLIDEMNKGLLERNEQVKLMLLAALAGEHVLLIGPPGTAKSELAKRLKSVFVEASYFERLLTRFSVPEELYGPLSIQALEDDKYKRLTSGYLPEASVAFIDEIFKANSAILNSLLTLLNEREFDNGNRRYKVPLISVVAASNELPEGEELSALYDRFMLRSFVAPVSNESFQDLLMLSGSTCDPELEVRLKLEDLAEVQQLSEKVLLNPSVIVLCKAFREHLQREDIYVSDRRWRKVIKLMKVSAFTTGMTEVSNYDAWILPHCLWNKPEELQGLKEVYEQAVAINGEFSHERLTSLVSIWDNKLQADKSQQRQKQDAKGRPLFINDKGNETIKSSGEVQKTDSSGNLIYVDKHYNKETVEKTNGYSGSNDPVIIEVSFKATTESVHYSKSHIQGRLQEVGELKNTAQSHIDALNNQLDSANATFNDHIWLDKTLLPQITASLENARSHTQKQLSKINKLEVGFTALPKEDESIYIDSDVAEDTALEGELCE